MADIMSTQVTKISDCAEILPGYSLQVRAEHEPGGSHQVLMGKHLTNVDIYRYSEQHKLHLAPSRSVRKYRVRRGDVLFVSRGVRNHAVLLESVPEKTIASATFYILHPHENIDPGYLAWCLNQAPIQARIAQVRTGAGTPIVQRKIFADIKIPVPSMDKQKQLATLGNLMTQEQQLQQKLVAETIKLHRARGQQLFRALTTETKQVQRQK